MFSTNVGLMTSTNATLMFSTNASLMFSTHPSSLRWPPHPNPKGHLQGNFDADDTADDGDSDSHFNDSNIDRKGCKHKAPQTFTQRPSQRSQ